MKERTDASTSMHTSGTGRDNANQGSTSQGSTSQGSTGQASTGQASTGSKSASQASARDRTLLPVFLVVFTDMLSFSLILPLLPYIAGSYGLSPFMVGLLLAMYPIGQVFGAPILGRLSDRHGRRPILLASVAGSVISLVVLALSRSIVPIFFSRLFDGLTGGNITIAQSYITDRTSPENRARSLGLIGAAFGLGFIIGPATGGILSQYGFHVPALLAASLAFANLLQIFFILPESLSREARERLRQQPRRRFSLQLAVDALRRPLVGPLLRGRVLYALSHGIFQTIFALHAQKQLGLDARSTGYILAYVGLVVVVVQATVIGRVTRRWPEASLLVGSSALLAVSYLPWAFAPSLLTLLVALIPISISSGILNTVLRSALTTAVSHDEVGSMLGIGTSLESLVSIATPIIGGFLLGAVGTWAPGVFSTLATAVLVGLLFRRLYRPYRESGSACRALNPELCDLADVAD